MQDFVSEMANCETEKCTDWVQRRSKYDIQNHWTLRECVYFLMLSPKTQKKLGDVKTTTEGALRWMAVRRIRVLLSMSLLDIGDMPYRTPPRLGRVYGTYEKIDRPLVAGMLNTFNDRFKTEREPRPRVVTTEAHSINTATRRCMDRMSSGTMSHE